MTAPVTALRKLNINQTSLDTYPLELGSEADGLQHFMLITEYKFKNNIHRNKDALTDFSDTYETDRYYESVNAFGLYLPKGSLKTQYSASHGPIDFGFFGALLNAESSDIVARLQGQLPGIVGNDDNPLTKGYNFWKAIGGTAFEQLRTNVENYDFKTKFGFNIGEAVGGLVMGKDKSSAVASLSMRKSGNPYATLVFQGVKERRQHAFAFDFYPRNSKESDQIVKIITKLKRGMLPGLKRSGTKENKTVTLEKKIFTGKVDEDYYKTIKKTVSVESPTGKVLSSAFFDYPSVYKIGIYKRDGAKNQFVHQIGQSSMLNLKVSYGDGSQQTFFKDTGAPQHIKLDVTFKENFALTRNFAKQLEGE